MRSARTRVVQGVGVLIALAALVVVFFWLNRPGAADGVSAVDVEDSAGTLPTVDQPAPGFTATTIDGEEISLDGFEGRPVWLIVNATWCSSCRSEIPDVQAIQASDLGDQVEILSVYIGEDAAAVSQFAERLGLTYRNVPDPDSAISAVYSVPGIPVHYFIDSDGVLRAIEIGSLGISRMEEQLEMVIG
ncbi:MAG TPA: TlpA disulfide reductase family protein [Actinomycetaceae bacterium]|nr:TlpA disulfide reductase family protein [Actinomycetaceae bacterium]